MATMSQGNKKITRKVVVVNNKIWVCSSSLMQPVFFKEIPATNYKILVFIGITTQGSSINFYCYLVT